MIKLNILCVSLSLVFVGCATLKSEVQNDPNYDGPTGKRVSISISDKEMNDLSETMIGKVIKNEASKWVKAKGFTVVDETKKAEQAIYFLVEQQSKEVYVPAQTYSVPVYGNNNGTTTTVKGSQGQTLGTLETEPSNPYAPTSYQQQYREGYNTSVTDRWLIMHIFSQTHGKKPTRVSLGQVYPEKRDQQFFENRQVMGQAVDKLLSQSPLAVVKNRIPASNTSGKDPGCWLRLGISFDKKEVLSRGERIKKFDPGNYAEKAGLKVGDVVYSIGGVDIPSEQPIKFSKGKTVIVLGSRDGEDLRLDVLPSMQCQD